jgi:hypothetical protein
LEALSTSTTGGGRQFCSWYYMVHSIYEHLRKNHRFVRFVASTWYIPSTNILEKKPSFRQICSCYMVHSVYEHSRKESPGSTFFIIILMDSDAKEEGPWGDWGEPSPCSRY